MGKIPEKSKVTLQDLLPPSINGWEAVEEGKYYNPRTIFDYIDGAGEVYRAYNFKKLLAQRYSKKRQPNIQADLFDMGSSRNAFGVFTHNLEGKEVGLGQDSIYIGGLLTFWKGRFFVSLYTEEETEKAKNTLRRLGRFIESRIKNPGERPSVINYFPETNLIENKIHYFYNHLILNYHFFVADENILLLDEQTDAALGKYREEGEKYFLLLIHYPASEKASQACNNFLDSYLPEAKKERIIQTEDQKWTAVQRMGERWLCIVFDAPSSSLAKKVLQRVEQKIS